MAHGKEFYDEKIPELVKLYKGGATIAELKKKWRCNGNPLVARLKAEGVYKEPGKKAAKPKAARKRRELIGNRITVLERGSKPRRQPRTATKAAPVVVTVEAAKKPAQREIGEVVVDVVPAAQVNPSPVDPLAATTLVDTNGAAVGKVSAWTADEEAEIARYQETEGLSRKSAVQKMRRRQLAAKK